MILRSDVVPLTAIFRFGIFAEGRTGSRAGAVSTLDVVDTGVARSTTGACFAGESDSTREVFAAPRVVLCCTAPLSTDTCGSLTPGDAAGVAALFPAGANCSVGLTPLALLLRARSTSDPPTTMIRAATAAMLYRRRLFSRSRLVD